MLPWGQVDPQQGQGPRQTGPNSTDTARTPTVRQAMANVDEMGPAQPWPRGPAHYQESAGRHGTRVPTGACRNLWVQWEPPEVASQV